MTSTATLADPQASTDRVNQPTLLGIPAEFRNIIYDKVFSSETKRGLAPHALTRVSQCIRRESLGMYYPSIKHKSLEILLHNPAQFAYAKRWLTEVDTSLYPVLPDIEFSWTEYRAFDNRKFALHCSRHVIDLKEEFDKQTLLCGLTGSSIWNIPHEVMWQIYENCFGFGKIGVWYSSVPSDFQTAVSEKKSWTVRHLSLLAESCSDPNIPFFWELANRKNGCDWEICDLNTLSKVSKLSPAKQQNCLMGSKIDPRLLHMKTRYYD
ncbi:hypothetical protein Q7P35_004186 [Cladosporium inversicolor]